MLSEVAALMIYEATRTFATETISGPHAAGENQRPAPEPGSRVGARCCAPGLACWIQFATIPKRASVLSD